MKNRQLLIGLIFAGAFLVVAIAGPVWAALNTKRFVLPPDKSLVVYCDDSRAGVWFLSAGDRKAVFKCVRVRRGFRGKLTGWLYGDYKKPLQMGDQLIVKAGGDVKRELTVVEDGPRCFRVYNW